MIGIHFRMIPKMLWKTKWFRNQSSTRGISWKVGEVLEMIEDDSNRWRDILEGVVNRNTSVDCVWKDWEFVWKNSDQSEFHLISGRRWNLKLCYYLLKVDELLQIWDDYPLHTKDVDVKR